MLSSWVFAASSSRTERRNRLCEKLESQHVCGVTRKSGCCEAMAAHCNRSVECPAAPGILACEHESTNPDCKQLLWMRQSRFDYLSLHEAQKCRTGINELSPIPPHEERCSGLEDPSRMKDRGFFVVRSAVSQVELETMRAFVRNVPLPIRYHCALSGVQPKECMAGPDWAARSVPQTVARINRLLQDWIRTGFNEDAALGWPLRITGGEFVSINRWKYPQNSSCIFQALFNAASERATGQKACVSKCPGQGAATNPCYARCLWRAVQTELSPFMVREVASLAASASSCASVPAGHHLIDDFYTFSSSQAHTMAAKLQ